MYFQRQTNQTEAFPIISSNIIFMFIYYFHIYSLIVKKLVETLFL